MIKRLPTRRFNLSSFVKFNHIVKFALAALLLNVIPVMGGTYSQEAKFTINMEDVTIMQVLDEITRQSDYTFAWSNQFLDLNKKTTVKVKNKKLNVLLDKVFRGCDVEYTIIEKKVVLIPAKREIKQADEQTGDISGVVKADDGTTLPGVNIMIVNSLVGSTTDINGAFSLSNLPAGSYELQFSFVGYITKTMTVTVEAGKTATLELVLLADVLNLNTVVVTGVQNAKTMMESSIAITTMNNKEIETLNTGSSAQLLEFVPGFYVETSGGDVGNNLFARGIPAAGAYQFVQIQEDGLPVFEDGALQFSNVDNYYRIDGNVAKIEAVRGGSSSIFASNSSGGIVNVISKTGGNQFSGFAKLTSADYGLMRTDLNVNGPISDNIRYSIGGFYRYGNGIRNAGFPGNVGGQIKGNLTFLHDKGYVRVNVKYLNDRNIFYLPIPLQNQDSPEGIPGFDPNYGTMASVNASKLSVPMPDGGTWNRDLENGIHPKVFAAGAEFFQELGNDWTLKNSFRNTMIDLEYDAMFSMGSPSLATEYASGIFGDNYQYSYADDGTVIDNPSQLNGNGLVVSPGFWSIDRKMNNFANNLSVTKTFGTHNITGGYYFSYYKATQFWYWSQVLMEVADEARLLNLVNPATGESNTWNGLTNIGFYGRNTDIRGAINALYLNDEFNITEKISADAGIRYEMGRYSGAREGEGWAPFPHQDTLLTEELNTGWNGNGQMTYFKYNSDELAWTLGLNYMFSDKMAAYVRASDGFRTPIEEAYMDNISDLSKIKTTGVMQYELGYKYSSPAIGVFANAFYMTMTNLPFTDVLASGASENKFAGAKNLGLELELIGKIKVFGLRFNGTFQNPQFTDFEYHTSDGTVVDNNGNQVRRIPKMFFHLTPMLDLKFGLNLYVRYSYYGEKFQDNENLATLPAYSVFGAGASYEVKNITFAVDGMNLTNTVGLTEGDPRVSPDASAKYYMARPILGRSIKFSISYSF